MLQYIFIRWWWCERGENVWVRNAALDRDRDARVYGLKRGPQTTDCHDHGNNNNNNNNNNTRLAATLKNITPHRTRAHDFRWVATQLWGWVKGKEGRGLGHILADVRSMRWLKGVCRARTAHPCPPHQSRGPPPSRLIEIIFLSRVHGIRENLI